jgi:hypothetical protein
MRRSNRDLLVLFKQEPINQEAMEHEVQLLHELLYSVECSDSVYTAHELIDLNRYKIIRKPYLIRDYFRQRNEKAFVFVSNKN